MNRTSVTLVNQNTNTSSIMARQDIILNHQGEIVKSTDTIFSTHRYIGSSLLNHLPFLESIFKELLKLKPGDPEIEFLRVENPANFLPGLYDFNFSYTNVDSQSCILWSIQDFTEDYNDLRITQQRENDIEIRRQVSNEKAEE